MYSRRTKTDTAGYAKASLVAIGAGHLTTLRVHNKGTSAAYVQLHDASAAPADGATPAAAPVPVPAGSYYESDTALDFRAGLYACASSTAATKTLIVGNDVWITAEYRY